MLALVYAHTYPDSVDGVIYDCPMLSAIHTARAIAYAVLPYFEQNSITEQIALCNDILRSDISPKEAFERSMTVEWSEGLNRFCHVIETEKYNEYIDKYIEDPHVTDDCWGKFLAFRQQLFASQDFYCDHLSYLAQIDKPQFLMVGEYDMTCGKYEQQWFTENAPKGRLEIIKKCAHLTWFEYPQKYTELIRQAVSFITGR